MSDLLQLLDGTIDDVKAGLVGKNKEDLQALLAAEESGKTRKGVIDALKAEIGEDTGNGAGEANGFEASGAPAQVVADVDQAHPALDVDPRANTSAEQNRIDFNDPIKPGIDVVTEQLGMTKPDEV